MTGPMLPSLSIPIEAAARPSALRITSRKAGLEIRIDGGGRDDRASEAGERLAYVSWYASAFVAGELAKACSGLLQSSGFRSDAEGWHVFAAEHVKTLVAAASTQANIHAIAAPSGPRSRTPWTTQRVARLGFLIGLGWTAKRIAADPLIRSTANNVYRQAHRFGLAMSDAPQGHASIRLPLSISGAYDRAAARAGMTREALVRRIVIAAGADQRLLDEASAVL